MTPREQRLWLQGFAREVNRLVDPHGVREIVAAELQPDVKYEIALEIRTPGQRPSIRDPHERLFVGSFIETAAYLAGIEAVYTKLAVKQSAFVVWGRGSAKAPLLRDAVPADEKDWPEEAFYGKDLWVVVVIADIVAVDDAARDPAVLGYKQLE